MQLLRRGYGFTDIGLGLEQAKGAAVVLVAAVVAAVAAVAAVVVAAVAAGAVSQ